jgi:hypothetical protein
MAYFPTASTEQRLNASVAPLENGDRPRLLAVLKQGLASDAHRRLAAKLAARQQRNGRD